MNLKRNFLVFLGLFLFFWGIFVFFGGKNSGAIFVFFGGVFNMTHK
jgi:hypothetical protein